MGGDTGGSLWQWINALANTNKHGKPTIEKNIFLGKTILTLLNICFCLLEILKKNGWAETHFIGYNPQIYDVEIA